MTYRDFALDKLRDDFKIRNRRQSLFQIISPVLPSDLLSATLKRNLKLPIKNKKSRSEWVIAPILVKMKENNNDFFTIYSGDSLNVDKERGLVGECDFIIANNYESYTIEAPLFAIVEAKKDNFDLGTSQCGAQWVAARIFNQKREHEVSVLYGAVTTADAWLFLKLQEDTLYIDTEFYYLNDLPKLLGVLQRVINSFKNVV